MQFQDVIMGWYLANKRDLPWRNTQDPYLIWLSEVILQQTRVAQGLPYFVRFCQHFPSVLDLANASEQEVLTLWQGLGYYSRGRNLHTSAKLVVNNFSGVFPTDYKTLLQLKGVGTYTAAAIASFSAGHRHAVVDGNVIRVLSRYFGVELPVDSKEGKKMINELADSLIEAVDPALYNQSVMEFGAMLCKPSNPDCAICPLALSCWALRHEKTSILPFKEKKIKKKERFFNYFIIEDNERLLLKERLSGDIWQGLYDFPMLEQTVFEEKPVFTDESGFKANAKLLDVQKHILTHQNLHIRFFRVRDYNCTFINQDKHKWIKVKDLDNYPKPIVIQNFLDKYLAKGNDRCK